MIDFVGGIGPVEKFILWSHGYGLAIIFGVVCVMRERQNRAAIEKLAEKAAEEMAGAQKEFDETVAALRKQYEAQLDTLQSSEDLIWVKISPPRVDENACPYCGGSGQAAAAGQ